MTANTNEVKEEILELLCGNDHLWTWGGVEATNRFTFERDGTGTISCGENQHDWFDLESKWSFTGEPPVKINKDTWRFTIQMTFTTRISPSYDDRSPWLKGTALQEHLQNPPPPSKAPFRWAPLKSAAFTPKQFTLTLSRGRFIEPFHASIKKAYPLFQFGHYGSNRFAPRRYRCQLEFDVSPFPPREEWTDSLEYGSLRPSLEYHQHWEQKRYVRYLIERKDEKWSETLDLGWWLSPSIGDSYKRGR